MRLEACEIPNGSMIINCYGHGGRGVILSWGCAADIRDIVFNQVFIFSTLVLCMEI